MNLIIFIFLTSCCCSASKRNRKKPLIHPAPPHGAKGGNLPEVGRSHNIYDVKCDRKCIEHSQCLNLKQQIFQYFTCKFMYYAKNDE